MLSQNSISSSHTVCYNVTLAVFQELAKHHMGMYRGLCYGKFSFKECPIEDIRMDNKQMDQDRPLHIKAETKWPPSTRRHFQMHFLDNILISIKISMKFVRNGQIKNIPALVQIMTWRRPGDKPLSEPMMAILLTHRCVTRPQRINMSAIFTISHIWQYHGICIRRYIVVCRAPEDSI